jgi:serine/threonine-protein kinase RsbW
VSYIRPAGIVDPAAETLVVPAELSELPRVSDWASDVAGRLALSESTLFAIHLCFEEAISNIVRHGRADGAGGSRDVRLALRREAGAVTATIEDQGVAFDPREVAAPVVPTSIEEAPMGGLGIHLMRRFTRELAYQRVDGTNRLTLRFGVE